MKKSSKIIILSVTLIFLTTFNPNDFNLSKEKDWYFFQIKKIDIINSKLVRKNEVEENLKEIYGKNIIFINRENIEKPLKSINFLDKIEVKKKYPNTIIIKIYETKPIALLFKKDKKYLIDSKSNLINFKNNERYKNLPNVFGAKGVEKEFIFFFNLLKEKNFPTKLIENFYYFKIGRWNIKLYDNKTIKYPSKNMKESIQKSVQLLNNKDFEKYNIIDLRINDKIIVE